MTALLETARLILRPATAADRDDLFALEQDPEVMRFINGGAPTPLGGGDGTESFLMPRGGEEGVWSAAEKPSATFIGWFSLQARAGGHERTAELGYRLHRTAWGRGLGSEGAAALIAAGFGQLGFDRIIATTMAVNHASRRVMEKAGLVYVRTVHKDWPDPLPGSEHGDVEYGLARQAWIQTSR